MEAIITQQQKRLFGTLPGFFVCKDLQSNYSYANQKLAELLGLQHQEEAVGMTDLDLPCGAVESAHLFRAQDREVIRSGQALRILDIHNYSRSKWRTLLFCKAPVYDENNNIVGTIAHGQELGSHELLELGVLLGRCIDIRKGGANSLFTNSISYTIGRPSQGPELSQWQEESLFLLLYGHSAQQIGWTLGITKRTVEKHLHLLKETFTARSDGELIDKASALGYQRYLPPGLAKRVLCLMPDDDWEDANVPHASRQPFQGGCEWNLSSSRH